MLIALVHSNVPPFECSKNRSRNVPSSTCLGRPREDGSRTSYARLLRHLGSATFCAVRRDQSGVPPPRTVASPRQEQRVSTRDRNDSACVEKPPCLDERAVLTLGTDQRSMGSTQRCVHEERIRSKPSTTNCFVLRQPTSCSTSSRTTAEPSVAPATRNRSANRSARTGGEQSDTTRVAQL